MDNELDNVTEEILNDVMLSLDNTETEQAGSFSSSSDDTDLPFEDRFVTEEQKQRDTEVTRLLQAYVMSDAYLEGYGKEIIEAFLNNNEERLLDTLRAKMHEKDRTEMDRYICPEWYRITKKSEAKDYIAEYGYVISAEKLKIYNNGKLLITMDRITAKEWLYLIEHSDKVDACYFYSDEKVA